MVEEGKPLVSTVNTLAEASSSKPTFVIVGVPTDALNSVATANKANVSFFSIDTLAGQTSGTVLLVSDGQVVDSLAAGGDIATFVSLNAYPLVGQLTPENYQFWQDRKLDLFWFGLNTDDKLSVDTITQGVQA